MRQSLAVLIAFTCASLHAVAAPPQTTTAAAPARTATVAAATPTASVRAEAETRSVDCGGAAAEIEGNRNTLTFTGACRGLTLRGDANTVTITLATGATIDIEGNTNRVDYVVGPGGGRPLVHIAGSDTVLGPAGGTTAPGPPVEPVRMTGDNQHIAVDCAGRRVEIQGNRSTYSLSGGCRAVTAHGDGNTLRAELAPGAQVLIEGNGTTLTFVVFGIGAAPAVTVHGEASTATGSPVDAGRPQPAPPPSLPPAAPAVPPPVPPARTRTLAQLMHDLDASVVADGTEIPFKADLLFDGNTDTLHADADMRLATVAALIAAIHPSALTVTGSDPSDADLAVARAQAVRSWFGPHGVTLPARASGASGGPAGVTILLGR